MFSESDSSELPAIRLSELESATYHTPPKRIGKIVILFVEILFRQINQEGREDETEKSYINSGDQFLCIRVAVLYKIRSDCRSLSLGRTQTGN